MTDTEHYTRFWRLPKGSDSYRTGLVVEQRFNPPAVRVQFPDRENVISWWLNIATRGTQDDKDYWMPDIGEQVVVLMDIHEEYGTVLGTVWSYPDTVTTGTANNRFIQFSDGTLIEYDRSTHQLSVFLGTGGSVTINTPAGNIINLDTAGNVNLTTGASQTLNVSQGGQAVADALVLVSKFLAQFNSHVHAGVNPGNSQTSPPVQQLGATDVESDVAKVSN